MTKRIHDIANAIARGEYEQTEAGVYIPALKGIATGEYFGRVNGSEWEKEGDNTLTVEGLVFMLNVALGATAKPSGLYLALFAGTTAPTTNWTASNFASVSSEITSQTEGYTSATRPAWTPSAAAAGSGAATIDNIAAAASLTIATASSLEVNGAALLTNSTRGGTTGALVSASKYSATRVFQDGDTYSLGYRVALTAG